MPNTIPPPPSGSIVYTDPNAQPQATPQAQPQTSGSIPPPPSGSIVYSQPQQQAQPAAQAQPDFSSLLTQNNDDDDFIMHDGDSLLTKAGKLTGGLFAGIGQGLFGTAAGLSDLGDRVAGIQPGSINAELHELAGQNQQTHSLAERAGQGLEALGEVFTGDEALKALSLSDRLAKVSQIAKFMEKYPVLTSAVGNALRLGTVTGTVAGVKTGNPEEALLSAITGAGAGAVMGTNEADRAATEKTKQGMEPWDAADPVEVQVQKVVNQLPISEGTSTMPEAELSVLREQAQNNYHNDIRASAEGAVRDALAGIEPPSADEPQNEARPILWKPGALSELMNRAGYTPLNPSSEFVQPSDAELQMMKGSPSQQADVLAFPSPKPEVTLDSPAYKSAWVNEYKRASLSHPDWTAAQVMSAADSAANAKFGITAPTTATANTGFDYIQPTSLRDQFGQAARTVLGVAKNDFATLDEASGGRWQRFNDQIQNVANKMDEVAGIDDDHFEALQAKRTQLEQAQAKMVEQLKAEGQVDPTIADRAQTLYRRGMALNDVNKAAQMATERQAIPGAGAVERVNPDKFGLRLAKLNDVPLDGGPSRLQQALGPEGAQRLIQATDDARVNLQPEAFANMEDTGKAALRALLRDNSVTDPTALNKDRVRTDYVKALKNFDSMGAVKQRAIWKEDVPAVRSFLRSRARWQSIPKMLLNRTGKSLLYVAGGDYLLHQLMTGDDK